MKKGRDVALLWGSITKGFLVKVEPEATWEISFCSLLFIPKQWLKLF